MSQQSEKTSERELVASILADAETQARSLLAEAETTARATLEEAEKKASAIKEEILAKAKRESEALTIQARAKARVEARRILLQAREDAATEVLGRIEKALHEVRGDTLRYKAALENLMAEAMLGIGEEHVVIVMGTFDKAIVDEALLEEVKERVVKSSGLAVKVDLKFDDDVLGGGCIAMDSVGRVRLDNTLLRRLAEAKQRLKPLIVAEIERHCG